MLSLNAEGHTKLVMQFQTENDHCSKLGEYESTVHRCNGSI